MPRKLETYDRDTITQHLAQYDHTRWTLNADGQLEATFTFENFARVMQFVNALAYLAETANHHPDMLIHGWKNVTVRLMTHDQGGVTDLDFALLRQIDALPPFK